MIVKLLPEMTLAFSYAEGHDGRNVATTTVNEFLVANGYEPNATKKYFFRMKVSHGNHEHVTYIIYAVVTPDTKVNKTITLVHLPAGEYLTCTISKREFEEELNHADQKIAEAAAKWLKENKKKFDMRNVIGLIEEDFVDGYEMYNIFFPIM